MTILSVESLEAKVLLSTGAHRIDGAAVQLARSSEHQRLQHVPKAHAATAADTSSDQVTEVQTVSLGNTTTNFTNVALSPVLNLFNPALGTLISVTVNHSATVESDITSQNRSTTSATVITAAASLGSQIDGLSQPFTQPTTMLSSRPTAAGVFGSGTDTVMFPPLELVDSATTTFTEPSDLAFYTSSSGRSAVTLTMNATAAASASAPNGNLLTTANSFAFASVTITYTYTLPCPSVAGIGRTGVHHQQTRLVVTFDGAVDPVKAANAANYFVITPSGQTIRFKSADYDAAANAVTLIPTGRLNVHYSYKLSVVLPCVNMQTEQTVVVPFGGIGSLTGFQTDRGAIVDVKHARIVGIDQRNDVFIPVHDGRIERVRVAPRSRDKSAQSRLTDE